jgi:hypothetical protein
MKGERRLLHQLNYQLILILVTLHPFRHHLSCIPAIVRLSKKGAKEQREHRAPG